MPMTSRVLGLLVVLALGATACADPNAPSAESGSAVTVTSCGQELTFESPPERVVTLDQSSTETLLELGLADRMVGTATWTDEVLPSLAAENAKVERLAEYTPSFETVLGKKPDLVTASFSGTLSKGGVAEYERFAQVGVPVYLSHVECQKAQGGDGTHDGRRTTPVTMDGIYQDVAELGTLTGTQDRAAQVVADLKRRMAAVRPVRARTTPTVAFWFSDSESPYVAGGSGSPSLIASTAGARNVYGDSQDEWPQVSWEDLAAKDPDVLVLADLTRKRQSAETALSKIAFLESNPVTRQMSAVRHKRYITLPGADLNPSIRTGDGATKVAAGLRKLGLGS